MKIHMQEGLTVTEKLLYPVQQKGGDRMTDTESGKGLLRIDGDKLKAAAALKTMSLRTLSEAMGMHYNSVLRIANEGTTSLSTLEQLCNVLDCSPLDLLVWEGFPRPKLDALASLLSQFGIEVEQMLVAVRN